MPDDRSMPESIPDTGMMGHNRPPLVESARADAKQLVAEHRERLQQFVKALATFKELPTRGKVEDATDAVGLARDFLKLVDRKRYDITGPLHAAQQAVIAIVEEFAEELWPEIDRVLALIEEYQRNRKKLVDQQRAMHEPVAALADAPPPRVAPVRGAYGKRASLRSQRVAKLTDPANISPLVLQSPKVIAAMESVATELGKNIPEIPGFTFADQDRISVA